MTTRVLLGLLGAITLLAGCNTDSSPEAAPQTTNPSTETSASETGPSQSPKPDIPQVTEPIDPTPWEDNPCDALTEKQQHELSIKSTPEPGATSVGSGCNWGSEYDDGISIKIGISDDIKSSIKGWYENNELGKYAYFEPTQIHDYPAVFAGLSDARDTGFCTIYIALQDEYAYIMGATLNDDYPGYDEPCAVLKDAAEMAMETMTEGGS